MSVMVQLAKLFTSYILLKDNANARAAERRRHLAETHGLVVCDAAR
jgi:hypothetical protein